MQTVVIQAEYARLRGVQKSTVTRAISTGRLSGEALVQRDGRILIDVEAADRQWPRAETETAERLSQAEQLAAAKLLEQQCRAELLDLKTKERTGELVRLRDVERAAIEAAVATRTALEQLPNKLAVRLAAETDTIVCASLLREAIAEILADLADALRRLATPPWETAATEGDVT